MWLGESQSHCFLYVYAYWPKPASSIAKAINIERTATYKMLEVLVKKWLLSESISKWVKQFFVSDESAFDRMVQKEESVLSYKKSKLPDIHTLLQTMSTFRDSQMPPIQFFEWTDGIYMLFDDIVKEFQSWKYREIICFMSQTLDAHSLFDTTMWVYAKQLITFIQKNSLSLKTILWQWISILEQIDSTYDIEMFSSIQIWSGSVNFFIVGECVYILIHNKVAFGQKIRSNQLAQVFHYFFSLY